MKIITAADIKFKEIVKLTNIKNCGAGYNTRIYALDDKIDVGLKLDNDTLNEYNLNFINHLGSYRTPTLDKFYLYGADTFKTMPIGRLPIKPFIIKESLINYKESITWLDADAFVIKKFDNVFEEDFDIGITVRPKHENNELLYPILNGFINCGVMFFKYNDRVLKFIDKWINEVPRTKFISDQEALNRLILKNTPPDFNLNKENNTFILGDIKFRTFSTIEYNYYYYPTLPPPETKIIHIKNNIRDNNSIHEWFTKDWS